MPVRLGVPEGLRPRPNVRRSAVLDRRGPGAPTRSQQESGEIAGLEDRPAAYVRRDTCSIRVAGSASCPLSMTMSPPARTRRCTETMVELEIDKPAAARLKVVGVGGAGGNAVNRMIGAGLQGVEFIVANTDVQALNQAPGAAPHPARSDSTRGLGSAATPSRGGAPPRRTSRPIADALHRVRHGLHHRRHGRRHRHRRGAGGGPAGAAARRR